MIDEKLVRCAVCGSAELAQWFRTQFGAIGRCRGCGQVLRADHPNRSSHVVLHQTSNLHLSTYALLSEHASADLRIYDGFLKLCGGTPGGRILDVGCGAGEFLRLALNRGFLVAGIEPIRELRTQAEQKTGSSILSTALEDSDFPDRSFDGVAIWDVIEHLVDPRGALDRVHALLRPGGFLGIATLNHRSLMYGIFHGLRHLVPPVADRVESMLFNPFHTYYFSKKSLARMVRAAGFDIVEHRGYEFPTSRLAVPWVVKSAMRCLYVVQGACGLEGEQYLLARKAAA